MGTHFYTGGLFQSSLCLYGWNLSGSHHESRSVETQIISSLTTNWGQKEPKEPLKSCLRVCRQHLLRSDWTICLSNLSGSICASIRQDWWDAVIKSKNPFGNCGGFICWVFQLRFDYLMRSEIWAWGLSKNKGNIFCPTQTEAVHLGCCWGGSGGQAAKSIVV